MRIRKGGREKKGYFVKLNPQNSLKTSRDRRSGSTRRRIQVYVDLLTGGSCSNLDSSHSFDSPSFNSSLATRKKRNQRFRNPHDVELSRLVERNKQKES